MAVFRDTALNQAGKRISRAMEAKSRELVTRHLTEADQCGAQDGELARELHERAARCRNAADLRPKGNET